MGFLVLALGPYVMGALVGAGIAFLLTKGKLKGWIWLYLAIPVAVYLLGVTLGYTRGMGGIISGPAISGVFCIPLAVVSGVVATRQRVGPLYHGIILDVLLGASTVVMMATRDMGE